MSIELKHLLQHRHWQTYSTFCAQYDKVAASVDATLVGTWPSRAQFHRWLSGSLRGSPHPHHCRVPEAMFPGRSTADLFGTPSPVTGGRPDPPDVTLVTTGAPLTKSMIRVVGQANECIVAVGSRSREPAYLHEIETSLRLKPNLVHYRILIGPLHSHVLKDHLARLIASDETRRTGRQGRRLYISMLDKRDRGP